MASAASRRFETSFSGSCRRKTSIPLSAAEATKRRAKSLPTGREPTRKRPRSAIASGVVVRALRARIRSHGLSTPRRTAVSKTPPPETSRYAKPAESRVSASWSRSAVGIRPASGSWPSSRMVVSTRTGTRRSVPRLRARDVAPFAGVDLDPVARVHEERNLHDGAGLELGRLRHVGDGVTADTRVGLGDRELDRGRQLDAGGAAVDPEDLHRA